MQQDTKGPFGGSIRVTRVFLAGRVAADPMGYVSRLNGRGTSLHFTILLENFRSGPNGAPR